jgi:hypothetical protein
MGSAETVIQVGAVVELQRPREERSPDGRPRNLVDDGAGRLALTARLFAETQSGERLICDRLAMGIGMPRCGAGAIYKRYVGPPALPSDPEEQRVFLNAYRVRRQDVADAVDQMLGRDPDQHRPPRLSWTTLMELLSANGLQLSEDELIALPFELELADEVIEQLDTSNDSL